METWAKRCLLNHIGKYTYVFYGSIYIQYVYVVHARWAMDIFHTIPLGDNILFYFIFFSYLYIVSELFHPRLGQLNKN